MTFWKIECLTRLGLDGSPFSRVTRESLVMAKHAGRAEVPTLEEIREGLSATGAYGEIISVARIEALTGDLSQLCWRESGGRFAIQEANSLQMDLSPNPFTGRPWFAARNSAATG